MTEKLTKNEQIRLKMVRTTKNDQKLPSLTKTVIENNKKSSKNANYTKSS